MAGWEGKFAYGDAAAGEDAGPVGIGDMPASRGQQLVDGFSGLAFGCSMVLIIHPVRSPLRRLKVRFRRTVALNPPRARAADAAAIPA